MEEKQELLCKTERKPLEVLVTGQAACGRWGEPQEGGKALDTIAEEVKRFRQTLIFIFMCELAPPQKAQTE